MDKAEALERIAGLIRQNDGYLVTSHVNPDGDSIGSQLACGGLLEALGKRWRIINHNAAAETYDFLPGRERVEIMKDTDASEFTTAIILDLGEWERMGDVAGMVNPDTHTVINIDHHQSNDRFGTEAYVDTEACSTSIIIFELIEHMNLPVSREQAIQLYTGILTDTGGFRFSNTNRAALEACARLIGYGADPSLIMKKVYYEKPVLAIRIMERLLSTLQFHHDDRIASVCLDQDTIASFGDHPPEEVIANTDGIIDYIRVIKGVEVALFFREERDGIKVSFRSNRDGLDMNRLAGLHGGGGHRGAAGAFVEDSLARVRDAVIADVTAHLEEHESH